MLLLNLFKCKINEKKLLWTKTLLVHYLLVLFTLSLKKKNIQTTPDVSNLFTGIYYEKDVKSLIWEMVLLTVWELLCESLVYRWCPCCSLFKCHVLRLFYLSSFCVLCPLLIVSLDCPLDATQYLYYTSENTVTVISDFTLTVKLVT